MASIKGAGAAEFAAGMYGVREAEQSLALNQAREDREAAEFEAARTLEDRQEDRLVRELEMKEAEFASQEEDRNLDRQLLQLQIDEKRLGLQETRRASDALRYTTGAEVEGFARMSRPDFLSSSGNRMYDELSGLLAKRQQLVQDGLDTTAIDRAIATSGAKYEQQRIADGRTLQGRSLLSSITGMYRDMLGEEPPQSLLELEAQLTMQGSNGLTGVTAEGSTLTDDLLSKLMQEHEQATRMVKSKVDRQFALDRTQNLLEEARVGLANAAMKTGASGASRDIGHTDVVQEWYDQLHDIQRKLQVDPNYTVAQAHGEIDHLTTRAMQLTANQGEGAKIEAANRAKLERERRAFTTEMQQYELFTTIAMMSEAGQLQNLRSVIDELGGRSRFDRDGGLFDPQFGDALGVLRRDEFEAFEAIRKRTEMAWNRTLPEERTQARLQQIRASAVREVDQALGKVLMAEDELDGRPESTLELLMAIEDSGLPIKGDPFAAVESVGPDGVKLKDKPRFSNGSEVARAAMFGFEQNLDESGRPVDATVNIGGQPTVIGVQAMPQQKAHWDPRLNTYVPSGRGPEERIIAALIREGYVEAVPVGVQDSDALQAGRRTKKDWLSQTYQQGTFYGQSPASWIFSSKAEEVIANGAQEVSVEGLMRALGTGKAALILENANRYAARGRGDERQAGQLFYSADTSKASTRIAPTHPSNTISEGQFDPASGKFVFPGSYPMVTNKDGSQSNVVVETVGIDGKFYVLPSMANGEQMGSLEEMVQYAERMGLDQFPHFKTQAAADAWAKRNHGKIRGTEN
jgi:hypothetical protein